LPSYEYVVMKHKFVPQHMQGVNNCDLQYKIPQSVTLLSAYRIPSLVWALGIHMRFLLNKAVPLSRERCKDAAGETFFLFSSPFRPALTPSQPPVLRVPGSLYPEHVVNYSYPSDCCRGKVCVEARKDLRAHISVEMVHWELLWMVPRHYDNPAASPAAASEVIVVRIIPRTKSKENY